VLFVGSKENEVVSSSAIYSEQNRFAGMIPGNKEARYMKKLFIIALVVSSFGAVAASAATGHHHGGHHHSGHHHK